LTDGADPPRSDPGRADAKDAERLSARASVDAPDNCDLLLRDAKDFLRARRERAGDGRAQPRGGLPRLETVHLLEHRAAHFGSGDSRCVCRIKTESCKNQRRAETAH
jgi:hypothetical protein